MKEFQINENDSGQRLDKFLQKAMPALPQSLMHKYIRLKRVKVNGKRSEIAYRLNLNDVISLYINDELFAKPDENNFFKTLEPRINIVYEDAHIILVDKAAGMVVHEDDGGDTNTLINHIKAYLYKSQQWQPDCENSFVPALCNRIDRYTGGIVIAAKTAEALRVMNEQIKLHNVKKYYLCLVHGVPKKKSARLEDYLVKNSDTNTVTVCSQRTKDAKTAAMQYRLLADGQNLSLLECELFTGRTHQIRVQLSSRGFPLVGDGKYGSVMRKNSLGMRHQALYSYKVKFDFQGECGNLQYLIGREFKVENVPFVKLFNEFIQK